MLRHSSCGSSACSQLELVDGTPGQKMTRKPSITNDSKVTKDGLMVLLGLSPYHTNFSNLEPLFVGFDIEASREQRHVARDDPTYQPLITEVGLAILDSRDLAHDVSSSPETLIRSESFTVHTEDDEPANDSVCLSSVAATVRRAIEIVDDQSQDNRLRNIVIVGHSPQGDLNMLKNLGLDHKNSATKYRVLDTHCLAREILLESCEPAKKEPWSPWCLEGVMKRLGCEVDYKTFHNADNDAHHHLNVMVKLGFAAFDKSDQNQATQSQQKKNPSKPAETEYKDGIKCSSAFHDNL